MERVIYKNNGGLGLILTNESESNHILPQDIILHGITLHPGDMTSIDGMFTAPMRYAGTISHPSLDLRVICLHAGNEENLFTNHSYYYCLIYLDQLTLINKFTENTARNFIWKDGKWK